MFTQMIMFIIIDADHVLQEEEFVAEVDLMKEYMMIIFIMDMNTIMLLIEDKDVLKDNLVNKKLMTEEFLIDSQELLED